MSQKHPFEVEKLTTIVSLISESNPWDVGVIGPAESKYSLNI